MDRTEQLKDTSRKIRLDILRLANKAGDSGAHIAPSLSMVEIISVLFTAVMDKERDIFILSKGHGGLAYYCGMYQAGMITKEQLDTFEENGGDFPGQPSRTVSNRVVFSSGSLGMGLSYAAGTAYACRGDGRKVYTLLGDGELNEGSVWEAAFFAAHNKLGNMTAVVDRNGMQSDGFSKDIIDMDAGKLWEACGWHVTVCDGHDEKELLKAFDCESDMPKVIIARTVKGKGISFMENSREWHHNRLPDDKYILAVGEIEQKL